VVENEHRVVFVSRIDADYFARIWGGKVTPIGDDI
jgi:hypothetical protein